MIDKETTSNNGDSSVSADEADFNRDLFLKIPGSSTYVVGFFGGQGVGKTTLCHAIKEYVRHYNETACPVRPIEVHVLSFAEPLRKMATHIFGEDWATDSKKHGVKDGPAIRFSLPMIVPNFTLEADLRPEVKALTYRETLCKLGPALQDCFGEDLFALAMANRIYEIKQDALKRGVRALVLIDDLRKKVEFQELMNLPCYSVAIYLDRKSHRNSHDYYEPTEWSDRVFAKNIQDFYLNRNLPYSVLNRGGKSFVSDVIFGEIFRKQLELH